MPITFIRQCSKKQLLTTALICQRFYFILIQNRATKLLLVQVLILLLQSVVEMLGRAHLLRRKSCAKKTLILTESAFAPFSLARSIPLITKLKSIGFDIFLCCQEPHKSEKFLVGVGEDNKALIKNLENFTLFDEETDFELMAKNNIASDKSVIIDYGKRNEINELLTKNISFKDGLLINHLGMSYEVIFQILHEPDEDHDTSYEKQLSFFNEYNNKIINGDDLAHCIRVAPEFTKKLFENHWDKITDGGQLTSCLSAAPEFMKKFLKDNPDFEEKLFENHGGKITNGRQLDACLEVNPKLADIFTKEYGGNKKSATDSKKTTEYFRRH